MISMDLNASPLPEDDEESYGQHVGYKRSFEEHIETSVETMRREREERRRRLQREDGHRQVAPPRSSTTLNTRPQTKPRSIPEGWLDCPCYGENIGLIVPSKVPLSDFYNDSVPPGKRYSSKQVRQHQKRHNREIGLVIDLTNTTRYYPSSEWITQGIKHVKIPCRGRDAVPDNESVNSFCHEVSEFIDRQRSLKLNKNKCILVHCTHGYNRTGYMIVNFLMRSSSQVMYITEAIQLFANARPPGIYKPDYIDALYAFYHERRPETVVCPPTPEWKRSGDLDLNGEAVQDDDDGDIPANDAPIEKEITNDDVLGDAIPFDRQVQLQQACCRVLKLPPSNRGRTPFPGSHPVSLSRDNLQLLRTRYYYATWKADGTRYMMLITFHGCYLIDRNFCFRRVQLRFPTRSSSNELHQFTLIDGEMIIDSIPTTDPSTGKVERKLERRYLAYDLMVLNLEPVVERPFSERWKLLEKEVIEPRNIDRRQNSIYRYDLEPFRVRRKDFWLLSTVNKLLKEFIPSLSHEADGLIFQGWDDPYVTRTHEGLLKWKYPEMNSVDFLFEEDGGRQLLYLFERGKKKLMEGAHVVFKDDMDVSMISGKVVECSYDKEQKAWSCMRIRMDKSTPNEISTFYKVRQSIEDNITEEILLEEISEIVQLPMYAERIAKAHHMQHAHASQRRR